VTVQLLDGEPLGDANPLLWETNALLGDAVFETMRSYGGRVLARGEHLARLARSAAWARLDPPSWIDVEREIDIVARAMPDGAVRVFLIRARSGTGARRLVTAEPIELPDVLYAGVTVCTLPEAGFGTPESPQAKYARYLPRMLARAEARERGFDDAFLVDAEKCVVSAATASVFVVVEGGLVTASSLEGITRALVVRLARERRVACEARRVTPSDLVAATEVFMTSSLREVVPVVRVDARPVGDGVPGKLTRELHVALRALARAT
jgi:branched-chain amino acid aminotransferase